MVFEFWLETGVGREDTRQCSGKPQDTCSSAFEPSNVRIAPETTEFPSQAGTIGYMAREFVQLKWDSSKSSKNKSNFRNRLTQSQWKAGDIFALGTCQRTARRISLRILRHECESG